MLGLDGLSPAFLDSPVVSSSMPNLRALLAGSAVGTLRSTLPPYTAPAWTTITTGMTPAAHGVFGFTDRDDRPVTADRVALPRVWDHVGSAGGRSVVVNVPLTHPPHAIDGVLVSGMPAPPGAAFAVPPEVGAELEAHGYVVDVPVREGARERRGALDRLRSMTEARSRAIALLADREPWDLLAAVFVLPDRLGHPWWKLLVPGHPLYDSRRGERFRRAASPALRALDDAIGELLASLPARTGIVVCSDHGFGPLSAEVFVDLELARAGLIDARPPGIVRRTASAVGRSRPGTLLPDAIRRRGARAVSTPAGARRAWTGRPYESGIWLADPADVDLRERVSGLLRGLRDPSGGPVVRTVVDGAGTDAPDLLCEMASPSVDLHDGLHAGRSWVSRERVAWGTHTPKGVIAIAGAAGELEGDAADVTPTVLAMMGLRPQGLDGRSLVPALEGARVVAAEPRTHGSAGYTREEEGAVLDHLRALGYVD
jgi:predicted AlkP superfamily phosphohydrolase/phosphomutase